MRKIISTFVAAFVLIGCQSKITGTLEVDGAPFVARQCRSGEAFGFYGIELTDTANRRLRVYPSADGTCAVALFKGDAATGDAIERCGSLTMEKQSSRINSITTSEARRDSLAKRAAAKSPAMSNLKIATNAFV